MSNENRILELTKVDTEFKREMGLFSAVSIIAGIMIGSGIFFIGTFVLQRSHNAPGFSLLVWLAGGVVSLLAGLCYAELGAAMPRSGGAYIYLREAYGPLVAFLSGWTMFWVAGSGSIAALAVGLGTYFSALYPLSSIAIKIFAIAIIIFLTAINCLGIKFGSLIQNIFMVGKLVPILIIIVLGLALGTQHNSMTLSPGTGNFTGIFAVALIASLWAYEGWTNLNTVAEEIKNPRKNLPLAIIIAITGVTAIYILFNYALLRVLPASVIASDAKPGATAAISLLGSAGGVLVTIGAFLSIFGSCNGCVLTFPRLYYAMAKDGLFFKWFENIHPEHKTPIPALIASAVVSILLIFTGSFQQLTTMVVFSQWIFYILAICSVFILRKKYPKMERPYKVWGYPVLPILVIIVSSFILINTLFEDLHSSLIGLLVPLIGIPVYYIFKNKMIKSNKVEKDTEKIL
ncbi:amino acid permease [Clostridium sp. PL3]|uniref:Amino acid permease n=1 Tax=Clostridium thailandense TaxID=2794346 RepID=A0A949TW29_9CLOT|nr:amino acid permease [Clostridium thailandense]MBV7274616.1 amino acid permease [Clostridium thailandense]